MFSKLASIVLQLLLKTRGFFPILIDECQLQGFPVSFRFDFRQGSE